MKNGLKIKKAPIIIFADILFILSIISLVLSAIIGFSFLSIALYYLMIVVVLIVTFFALFKQLAPWFEGGQKIHYFLGLGYAIIPYIIGVGIASSVAALIIYITQKDYVYRKSRIITTSVFTVLHVIAMILRFTVLKFI